MVDYRVKKDIMYMTIQRGDVNHLKTLLQHKDTPLDDEGRTPVYVAAKEGNAECLTIMIEAGADVNKADIDGVTPVRIASKHKETECMIQLIQAGADVNIPCKKKIAPIHYACVDGDKDRISILINAGADVNAETIHNAFPVYIVCYSGFVNCLSVLIDAGADVNKEYDHGAGVQTSLHIATCHKNIECVKKLVKAGANIAFLYKNWATLQHAKKGYHHNIASFIEIHLNNMISSRVTMLMLAHRSSGDQYSHYRKKTNDAYGVDEWLGNLEHLPTDILQKIAFMIPVPHQFWLESLPELDWRSMAIAERKKNKRITAELAILRRMFGGAKE